MSFKTKIFKIAMNIEIFNKNTIDSLQPDFMKISQK